MMRMMSSGIVYALAVTPFAAGAQQRAHAPAPLVFDGVTVVDVETGKTVPSQRIVVVGNRIEAVGPSARTAAPKGAHVVRARGKYAIPGLWDIHAHSAARIDLLYSIYLVNGVTGFREPGSAFPLDSLRRWRQQILDGQRVGPPRQILSGPSINHPRDGDSVSKGACPYSIWVCVPAPRDTLGADTAWRAAVLRVVDSLHAAGADMLKPREIGHQTYYAIAAEARRLGMPFGGHADDETVVQASDSGARIIDHLYMYYINAENLCGVRRPTVEQCRPVAEHLRRNGTWLSSDIPIYEYPPAIEALQGQVDRHLAAFWAGQPLVGNWLHWDRAVADSIAAARAAAPATGLEAGPDGGPVDPRAPRELFLHRMEAANMPLLLGTDLGEIDTADVSASLRNGGAPGFGLQANLARSVALGLSPLYALQAATINPAKMLRGTDSLGTIARGKLADIVLLDGNPLQDITNTSAIHAVVANGRYFDRAALDSLLAHIRTKVNAMAKTTP